ncbi:MAG: PTS sugar transporter subunit IIA [Planctomycetota bacterium]|jgi:mannitol/fructose-specific phosphotransferase system IIA component (Ntr-type)
MKLADVIVADAIIPELRSKTRDEAIEELIDSLSQTGAIPKKLLDESKKAVLARENQATTGIGRGIALPHAKVEGMKKPVGTIGRSSEGMDFSALDAKPVYSLILLLSDPDNPDEHLQAMEVIFKHVQRDMFRKFLRQSETKEAIIDLVLEADELG